MQGYSVQFQSVGVGPNKTLAKIKSGAIVPSENKTGGFTMIRLKSEKGNPLPFLKVVIASKDTSHQFEIRWSNYRENKHNDSPGKFRIIRVDFDNPLMLYITENGRTIVRDGRKFIDYTAMAMRYNSHYDEQTKSWNLGPDHPRERKEEEFLDSSSIDVVNEKIEKLFGEDVANEVMALFFDNDEFRKFLITDEALVTT